MTHPLRGARGAICKSIDSVVIAQKRASGKQGERKMGGELSHRD